MLMLRRRPMILLRRIPEFADDAFGYETGKVFIIFIFHRLGKRHQSLDRFFGFGYFFVRSAASFAMAALIRALARNTGVEFHDCSSR
jgi:hypothetical protein